MSVKYQQPGCLVERLYAQQTKESSGDNQPRHSRSKHGWGQLGVSGAIPGDGIQGDHAESRLCDQEWEESTQRKA